nr:hypothetical protein [Tanacetum cinerariifolium]
MEDLKQQYLDELKRLSNLEFRDEEQCAYLSTHPSKRLTSLCYNGDDDDDEGYTSTITPDEPVLSTEEPNNSLSMGDKHLDTIPATESNEFIKYGVETLIPIPSESEGIPDHRRDVPFHNNTPPLNVLKDQFEDLSEYNEEFSSTNDDSFSFDSIDSVEASPLDSELVSSKVMEIVTLEVGGIEASNDNPIPFYDPIISRTPLNLTPSGESDFFLEVEAFLAVEDEPTSSQFPKSYLDPEGDMLLLKAFLNDDHSSDFKQLSRMISLMLNTNPTSDSDSLMEEIDSFCTPDYPMLPGIEDKDYDFERDILILKDLPSNNTFSFAKKESFHFNIPLFSRPSAKPPDGDTGILNIKMMGDIYDQKSFMHKLMITLASHQEKSPDLLSHRCGTVKKFNTHRIQPDAVS